MTKSLPPQIVGGAKQPSFAFTTVTERWPKIIAGIVDRLHKSYQGAVARDGQEAGNDVNSVIAKLSELRYRIMTGKPLERFEEENVPDAATWNSEIDRISKEIGSEVTWFNGPWLFVECYMYRLVWHFLQRTQFLRDHDPFWEEKEKAYESSMKYLLAIGTELVNLLDRQLGKDEIREALLRLIQISLWGNKCDLSLTGGDPHSMSATIFHELEELRPKILADDIERAIDGILLGGGRPLDQIDLILDNAGLELFMDICLADFFVSKGVAKKVVLHGKAFPWFVSDTVRKDLDWMVQKLASSDDPFLSKLGARWANHMNRDIIEFRSHQFWTTGFDYSRMREIAPDLYQQLSASSFLVFKGDLNYRKLVGDREWPHQTPFAESLCGFSPTNLLALRTLKAETISGLGAEAIQKIGSKFGRDDLSWMTSSDYAVAQLYEQKI